jgi:hypothetical protein
MTDRKCECTELKHPLTHYQVALITAYIAMLTNEQRVTIFNSYCRQCGSHSHKNHAVTLVKRDKE